MNILRYALAAAALLAPVVASAAIVPVTGGNTVIRATAPLADIGITASLTGSATLVAADPLTVNLPITGGSLDTTNGAGTVVHTGSGVNLRGTNGNILSLFNFTVDSASGVLRGNVQAEGGVALFLSQAPLFTFTTVGLSFAEVTDLANPQVPLLFTAEAAAVLSRVFGAPDLTGGQFALGASLPTVGVAAVPEPAALALFGLGALGLAIARRGRAG